MMEENDRKRQVKLEQVNELMIYGISSESSSNLMSFTWGDQLY